MKCDEKEVDRQWIINDALKGCPDTQARVSFALRLLLFNLGLAETARRTVQGYCLSLRTTISSLISCSPV